MKIKGMDGQNQGEAAEKGKECEPVKVKTLTKKNEELALQKKKELKKKEEMKRKDTECQRTATKKHKEEEVKKQQLE